MNSKIFTDIIADRILEHLEPLGFHRIGVNLICDRDDVALLINLNKDSATRKDKLVVSFSVGVFSKDIYRERRLSAGLSETDISIRKLKYHECHLTFNIAYDAGLTNGVKHWTVTTEHEAQNTADEILELLTKLGLQTLEKVGTKANLTEYLNGCIGKKLHDFPALRRTLSDAHWRRVLGENSETIPP